MPSIYVGHSPHRYPGDIASWVIDAVKNSVLGAEWSIRGFPYNNNAGFEVLDLCSRVLQQPGPVLLIRPVQASAVLATQESLAARVPVITCDIESSDQLREQMRGTVTSFLAGEPLVHRDYVVALLLMRKLDRDRMWAGNSKGYKWADDIPTGRGLDEVYADRVPHVLSVLLGAEILVHKTSQSSKKYALNPDRREEIYQMLRDRRLQGQPHDRLRKGDAQISIRELDVLSDYAE